MRKKWWDNDLVEFSALCHLPERKKSSIKNKSPKSQVNAPTIFLSFCISVYLFSVSIMNRNSFLNRIVSCWYSQLDIAVLSVKQSKAAIKWVIWLWQRLHTRFISGYHWNHCVAVAKSVCVCVVWVCSMYLTRGHIKMNFGHAHHRTQTMLNHWSQHQHIKYKVMYSTL